MASFFKSWRSHYFAGSLYGLVLKGRSNAAEAIDRLDRWAWQREWQQNLKANNPNEVMSDHQQREAKAWGAGARVSAGVDTPYPSPPYPPGATWEG